MSRCQPLWGKHRFCQVWAKSGGIIRQKLEQTETALSNSEVGEKRNPKASYVFLLSVGDDVSRTAGSPQQATWNLPVPKYGEGQGCSSLTLSPLPTLIQVTGQADKSAPTGRTSSLYAQPLLPPWLIWKIVLSHSTPTLTPPWTKPPWWSSLQSLHSLLTPRKHYSLCVFSLLLANRENSVIITGCAILVFPFLY